MGNSIPETREGCKPMRERIARAITFGPRGVPTSWSAADVERYAEQYSGSSLATADAVLDAMREPSEEMVKAGDACDQMLDEFTATPLHSAECEVHWYAMIDAAKAGG